VYSTGYRRWYTKDRELLFKNMNYINCTDLIKKGSIPKLGSDLEKRILKKVASQTKTLDFYVKSDGEYLIYYTRKLSKFVQILDVIPTIYDSEGKKRNPSELKSVKFDNSELRDVLLALLNSNLFYWYLTVYSDCRNLNKREVYSIPFDFERSPKERVRKLARLAHQLMKNLQDNSEVVEMNFQNLGKMTIQCIYPKLSKPIIDEIDRMLAQHFDFTKEELDFIINYDIGFRMGKDESEDLLTQRLS
jgi:hypothetical protein